MKQESPYSFNSFVDFLQQNFALFIVAALFFVGGFFLGSMWTENQMLRKGGTGAPTAAAPADPAAGDSGVTKEQLAAMPEVTKDDHIKGSSNATITLVEYSDFECPFCSRFHPVTQQILQEYGDKVALVYRHYPLPFHPNAQKAAEASECIAKQGGNDAFWKYADAVFAKQEALGGKLTPEAITESAQASGVNMTTFKSCLDSGEMAANVQADQDGGSGAGIGGTPGTVVVTKDGAQELIPGAYPFDQVKPILDKYLQ
jgi:protein-disulfide isomerase